MVPRVLSLGTVLFLILVRNYNSEDIGIGITKVMAHLNILTELCEHCMSISLVVAHI